jgi:pimeloyl-ACP methyl ester carboxylesterase
VPRFRRVALVGHSLSGAIAQVEAYSYGDVDALGVLSWEDNGTTQRTSTSFTEANAMCGAGGQPAEGGGPGGYAYFGQTEDDYRAELYHDADPSVVTATLPLRNLNPCGDLESALTAITVDQQRLADIHVPVIVAAGKNDAVCSEDGARQQRDLYTGSPDASLVLIDDMGHALTLERRRSVFRDAMAAWLDHHGLGASG